MDIMFENSKLEILFKTTKAKVAQGAATISQKAEDVTLTAKLRRRIRDLEEEIDLQLAEVGALVYATHTGSPTESEALLAKLSEIDAAQAEVDAVQAKINAARGIETCIVCGSRLLPGDQFCRECGAPR